MAKYRVQFYLVGRVSFRQLQHLFHIRLSSEAYSAADFVVVRSDTKLTFEIFFIFRNPSECRMLSGNNTCRGDSGGAIVAKWKGRVEVVLGTLSFTCATDK